MRKREIRSGDQFKTSNERLQEIMFQINRLQAARLERRATILAGQQQLESISEDLEETLKKQNENLDKLMKLASH